MMVGDGRKRFAVIKNPRFSEHERRGLFSLSWSGRQLVVHLEIARQLIDETWWWLHGSFREAYKIRTTTD